MALVLGEGTLRGPGDLLLDDHLLAVSYTIMVEWIRGVPDPTWYGYFSLTEASLHVLPGAYALRLPSGDARILLHRAAFPVAEHSAVFAFWGIGPAPAIEQGGSTEDA